MDKGGGDGSSLFSVMKKNMNEPVDGESSDSSDYSTEMTHNSGKLKAKAKKETVERITSNAIGKHKERPSNVVK